MLILSIENIIGSLDRVRKSGRNKWRAPCPVHGGKDLNMIISERSDGSVGAHCFVCGANGVDLVDTLGFERSEIFAPDSEYQKPVITRQMQEEEQMDRMIMAMAENSTDMTLEDKRRVRLAKARLEGIDEKRRAVEEHNNVTNNVDNGIPF